MYKISNNFVKYIFIFAENYKKNYKQLDIKNRQGDDFDMKAKKKKGKLKEVNLMMIYPQKE